jgi:hypothetical protein
MWHTLRSALRRRIVGLGRSWLPEMLESDAVQEAIAGMLRSAGTPFPDVAAQIQLMLLYRRLVHDGTCVCLRDVGFKCSSQTDEDGILLYLFAVLGTTDKRCVEICAGDGRECNTANLILMHGWDGLLVDGDAANVERGRRFYAESRHTYVYPPRFLRAWVTREHVNRLIEEHGIIGEVDLLSIDVDGVDYWIWDAMTAITPRVVIIEYNDILGPDRSCTVPYRDDFTARTYPTTDGQPNYLGASLRALAKLGAQKGYRLVGTNRYGYNAFFVRQGLGEHLLPAVAIEDCFTHRKVQEGMRTRFPTVAHLPWVDV